MQVERWSLLAGLRFALALVVAMDHLGGHPWLGRFGAFEAVLGFLAISGYSVTMSLAQRPDGFLRRRLMRVLPAYLVSLALALLITVLVDHQPLPGAAEIVANSLLLNQLVTSTSLLGPAWSLALECWFYALLPLLATRSTGQVRGLAWASFAAFAAYTAARSLFQMPYYAGIGFGGNAVLLAFAWFNGSLLARDDAARSVALRDLRWMFAAHIALDALVAWGHRFKHHEVAHFASDDLPGLCLQGLTLWVVLHGLSNASAPPAASGVRVPAMTALGDWSYPLYVVHVPVYAIVGRLLGAPPLLAFGAALAAAVLLHYGVERPWRRTVPAVRLGPLDAARTNVTNAP